MNHEFAASAEDVVEAVRRRIHDADRYPRVIVITDEGPGWMVRTMDAPELYGQVPGVDR